MPETLRDFLKSLTPNEACEIHEYFDAELDNEEINEILYARIETNPELWNETFGNSILDDRDATSIHD